MLIRVCRKFNYFLLRSRLQFSLSQEAFLKSLSFSLSLSSVAGFESNFEVSSSYQLVALKIVSTLLKIEAKGYAGKAYKASTSAAEREFCL